MTAATAERASLAALKSQMQYIIAAAIDGIETDNGGKCDCGEPECIQARTALEVLDEAFRAIDRAATGTAAVTAYMTCWCALTGIPAGEWSVGVAPAVNGGNE